jgi:hypothetical protein
MGFDSNIRNFDIALEDFKTQLTTPTSPIYYPAWNNFDGGDIGETVLKLLASYTHSLDSFRKFYLDNLYLPTDEQDAREQIYEMLNLKYGLKRAMILTICFMWKSCGPLGYAEIPKFFKMSLVADGVSHSFLALKRYVYMPHSPRMYVDIILGDLEEQTLVVGEITGNKILLSSEDIDSESVVFSVDGFEWTQVRNIYYSKDKEKRYSIHREFDGTYIYLPDEWRDYTPSEVSDVVIQCAVVKPSFDINTQDAVQVCLLDSIICSEGDDVTNQFNVYLMNTKNSATFGSSGKRRVITLEDFESESKGFSGVQEARAFNWSDGILLNIKDPNEITLVVVGYEGALSNFVKSGLYSYLTSICLPEFNLTILDPIFRKIDVRLLANIGDYKDTVFEAEIYQNIRTAILSYMNVDNTGIGYALNTSEMMSAVVRSDSRIRFIDLRDYVDYFPKPNEIPILGNLSVEFDVNSYYTYDLGYLYDSGESGPFGIDVDTADDYMTDMVSYLYVSDTWYWDADISDAEVLDRMFYDEGISVELSEIYINILSADSGSIGLSDSSINMSLTDSGLGSDDLNDLTDFI